VKQSVEAALAEPDPNEPGIGTADITMVAPSAVPARSPKRRHLDD